jgi:hypothetical protein
VPSKVGSTGVDLSLGLVSDLPTIRESHVDLRARQISVSFSPCPSDGASVIRKGYLQSPETVRCTLVEKEVFPTTPFGFPFWESTSPSTPGDPGYPRPATSSITRDGNSAAFGRLDNVSPRGTKPQCNLRWTLSKLTGPHCLGEAIGLELSKCR